MKPKRWWQKKKVWGTILSVVLGLAAPQLGIPWVQTLTAVIAMMTGVMAEAVVDAAAALRNSVVDIQPKA